MQAQLASLASRSCHCSDVDKLMVDMPAAIEASTQAFNRIQAMEHFLTKLVDNGAPLRSPPGVPLNPGAGSSPVPSQGGDVRGEPFATKFIGQKSYRVISDLGKLFDDKAATSSTDSFMGDANKGVK